MIKAAVRTISTVFGMQSGVKIAFHPSRTCPECGTKLAARRDSLYESQTVSHRVNKDGDSCNSALRDEETAWHCPNLDCPAKVRERIEHWCSSEAMNIAGADTTLVAQLVSRGLVRDVAELYLLKPAEVAALEGRNKEFATRFLGQLADSKSREAWRLLHGLHISEVDAEVAQRLCHHFAAVDDILAAGPERLTKQAGVGEKVAHGIAYWYGDSVNRRLVRRLQKAGVNFKTAV